MTKVQLDDDLRDTRKAKFLEAYKMTGVIQPAIDAAGISRASYRKYRKDDKVFHQDCFDAYDAAVDEAEVELRKRGIEGYDDPVMYKGEQTWCRNPDSGDLLLDDDFNPIPFTRPIKSDYLLNIYTRSHRPIYKEKTEIAITGPGGGSIEHDFQITFIMPDGKTIEDYESGATPKMDHKTGKPLIIDVELDPLDQPDPLELDPLDN